MLWPDQKLMYDFYEHNRLEVGEKVVICCRVGVSRSNAIALGALVYYFKMDFHKAMELVSSKVRICNILHAHVLALQKLFKC
jgi:predicted protein tyrosine phosphatase